MTRRRLTSIVGAASAILVALQTFLAGELSRDVRGEGLVLVAVGAAAISVATLGAFLTGEQ